MTPLNKHTAGLTDEEKHDFIETNGKRDLDKETQGMDNLFLKLGDPGKIQVIWFFLLACSFFTVSPNAVVGVFFGYSPSHVCNTTIDWSDIAETPGIGRLSVLEHLNFSKPNRFRIPNDGSSSTLTSTYSRPQMAIGDTYSIMLDAELNKSVSSQALGFIQYGSCSINVTLNATSLREHLRRTTTSKSCERGEWVYDVKDREATTVTDFDLICDHQFLSALASTLYYLGLILGSMTLGYASDVFGRRPVILLTLHLILLTGLGIFFAKSFLVFAILRVVMGLLTQGLLSAAFVMAIELFPIHHRGRAGAVMQLFWGLGNVYLSGVAWLAQDWRLIQLGLLLPTVFSAITLWFASESLRWMLAKGKTQRACETIERMSRLNKVTNPILEDDHSVLAEYKVHCEKHHSSYVALVRTPQMRRRTFCLSLVLFGVNAGYFGMTYNNAELAGDRYVNFLLGAITESISYAMGAFVVVRFGRKKTLLICLLVGSICCVISGVIKRSKGTNDTFITIFSVMGRFAMAMCFCACDTYTAELFPTIVRNMGVGVCNLVGRVGSALAPQISALRYVTFAQLPPLVFALFAFIGAMSILLLPETHGQRLPDTVDDVEQTPNLEPASSKMKSKQGGLLDTFVNRNKKTAADSV